MSHPPAQLCSRLSSLNNTPCNQGGQEECPGITVVIIYTPFFKKRDKRGIRIWGEKEERRERKKRKKEMGEVCACVRCLTNSPHGHLGHLGLAFWHVCCPDILSRPTYMYPGYIMCVCVWWYRVITDDAAASDCVVVAALLIRIPPQYVIKYSRVRKAPAPYIYHTTLCPSMNYSPQTTTSLAHTHTHTQQLTSTATNGHDPTHHQQYIVHRDISTQEGELTGASPSAIPVHTRARPLHSTPNPNPALSVAVVVVEGGRVPSDCA